MEKVEILTADKTVIIERLEKIFRDVFSSNSIKINRNLTANDVENWNSLNHMILISEVENEFSIVFKLKEINKMGNIGDMIDLIASKM